MGLRLLEDSGLLAVVLPELAAQRGVPQDKIPGDDLWDHTLRTVDAAPADRPVVRLAALLHDVGKPATLADGHFHGHDAVGAEMADGILKRLRIPGATIDRVNTLVARHMFTYEPAWSDTAVRRFIRTVGPDAVDELFLLRAADDVGSGLDPADSGLADLRRRVDEQRAARAPLGRADLVIDGDDLMHELGIGQGPTLGRILDDLVEQVLADPALNDRASLLLLAQAAVAEDRLR